MGKSSRDKGGTIDFCSFCGKDSSTVFLIAGPGDIRICSECTDVCSSLVRQEIRKPPSKKRLKKLPTPREIKEKLDDYIIGQEQAKKVISVAVHNHYRRIPLEEKQTEEVELEKSNILMIGPSGVGKTLIAKTLAQILEVPFAIGDATTLTEAGYVGEDVENLLLRLLQVADWDIEEAEKGILYIDEMDKIGRTMHNVSITRDVSGEGVQQALLKMLEGTIANVPPQGGRKHPEQRYIQIDTSKILFICGGTFSGLEKTIGRRLGRKMIGFNKETSGEEIDELGEILTNVEPEDLIEFGLIPELVGRVPVITTLSPLTEDEMIRIMLEPKNAVLRQYEKYITMEGCTLESTKRSLREIAKLALEKNTGARGLRAIIEEIMLDVMYELPERPDVKKLVLTPEAVRNRRLSLPRARRKIEGRGGKAKIA